MEKVRSTIINVWSNNWSKGDEYVLDRRIMTSLISLFGLRLIQMLSLLYTPIIFTSSYALQHIYVPEFFFHLQRNWNIPKHLLNNCKSSPPPLQQGSRGNRNVSEIVPTKNPHWLTGVWIVHIPLPIQSDSFWSIDFLWISIRCRPCALLPPTVRDHTERRDLSQLAVSDRS